MTEDFLVQVARAGGVEYSVDVAFLARLVAGMIDGIEIAWLVEQDDAKALASFHALADYCLMYMVREGVPVVGGEPRQLRMPADVATDQPFTDGEPKTISV